jgi:magnesium transporter
MIGRITHDDLLDAADEEAAEDLYRMAGTDAAELETSSAVRAARIRLTWLLPCMVGMLVTATVLGVTRPQFSASLFGALALFVPMIGAMGGNSGIQISTIIVRGFATGELGATKLRLALMREGRIAMVMSLVCGVTAWLLVSISLPWLQSLDAAAVIPIDASRLSLAVGLAMASAILVAAMLGIALPFAFRRFGVDPAIASGPIVTTTNDVISVAVYMTLAMMIAR